MGSKIVHLNQKQFCPLNTGHLFAELKCRTNEKYGQVKRNIGQIRLGRIRRQGYANNPDLQNTLTPT